MNCPDCFAVGGGWVGCGRFLDHQCRASVDWNQVSRSRLIEQNTAFAKTMWLANICHGKDPAATPSLLLYDNSSEAPVAALLYCTSVYICCPAVQCVAHQALQGHSAPSCQLQAGAGVHKQIGLGPVFPTYQLQITPAVCIN